MKQLVLLAVIFTLFSASVLAQQKRKQLPDSIKGLHLSIDIEEKKESYHSTDVFLINIKLKNVGKSPITLYKDMGWGWSSSFFLGLSNNRGFLMSHILDDSQDFPPYKKEDFITLKPDEEIKEERFADLKHYKITKSGIYQVVVWFASPVFRKYAPEGMKILAREDGRLQSKPIKFRIEK